MKLRQPEIEIIHDNPFVNCKLNRGQYADVLTKVIEKQEEGFVLAINNEWGTGKTTFVRMWQKKLEISGYKTIYFNAWENDFESDSLVALISEFKGISDSGSKKIFDNVIEKALPVARKVVPSILKALSEKYIGKEFIQEILKEGIDGTTDLFEKELDNYLEKKKSISSFKESLDIFINKTSPDKPIIFFIDELDRCRPSYAVNLLEQVKHLFSVNRVIFVLSIDKIQLGNAVRGFYGSDRINAEEYLRRFFDLEYTLPSPNNSDFCNFLYENQKYDEFFESPFRTQYSNFQSDKSHFLQFAELLFNSQEIQLRVQEKIMTHCRVSLSLFRKDSYVMPIILLILVYLKYLHTELYNNIKSKKYTDNQLIHDIEIIFSNQYDDEQMDMILFMEVFLVLIYLNSKEKIKINNFINVSSVNQAPSISFKSKFDKSKDHDNSIHYIQWFFNPKFRHTNLNIDYFIKKIELSEPFK